LLVAGTITRLVVDWFNFVQHVIIIIGRKNSRNLLYKLGEHECFNSGVDNHLRATRRWEKSSNSLHYARESGKV
jgi:hypothetical protein